jgi:hypothetical protein
MRHCHVGLCQMWLCQLFRVKCDSVRCYSIICDSSIKTLWGVLQQMWFCQMGLCQLWCCQLLHWQMWLCQMISVNRDPFSCESVSSYSVSCGSVSCNAVRWNSLWCDSVRWDYVTPVGCDSLSEGNSSDVTLSLETTHNLVPVWSVPKLLVYELFDPTFLIHWTIGSFFYSYKLRYCLTLSSELHLHLGQWRA